MNPLDQDTRECPYCAETIKKRATICRYCGRDIATGKIAIPAHESPTAVPIHIISRPSVPTNFARSCLAIILLFPVLSVIIIGSVVYLQGLSDVSSAFGIGTSEHPPYDVVDKKDTSPFGNGKCITTRIVVANSSTPDQVDKALRAAARDTYNASQPNVVVIYAYFDKDRPNIDQCGYTAGRAVWEPRDDTIPIEKNASFDAHSLAIDNQGTNCSEN